MRIILASSSPRRKKLLEDLGIKFEVMPSHIDESGNDGTDFGEYAKILSRKKAESIASKYRDSIVIGADTIVVLDDEILGKPVDERDARRMLHKLSGRTHKVYSGICIVSPEKTLSDCDVTEVTFKSLNGAQVDGYLRSSGWRDKAGSYAIQEGLSKDFVASYQGSYNTVVGFPTEKLIPLLEEFGITT